MDPKVKRVVPQRRQKGAPGDTGAGKAEMPALEQRGTEVGARNPLTEKG